MYLFSTGKVDVAAILAPTLNFVPSRGLRYAVSFDDEAPQVVTLVPQNYNAQNGNRDWEKSVEDNARYGHTTHPLTKSGYHTLKFWMVDPGIMLQKLVVNLGGVKPSYLGPPESYCNGREQKPSGENKLTGCFAEWRFAGRKLSSLFFFLRKRLSFHARGAPVAFFRVFRTFRG